MNRYLLGASLAVAVSMTAIAADDDLKSGEQKPSMKIQAFNPLHCSGKSVGSKNCLVWSNGGNPVAMIFAREVSDNLTSLVKAIDKATVENAKKRMGSFVVFCSDKETLEAELKELAKKEKLSKCVLSLVDSKSGPGGYDLHKDADITVVLYSGRKTKAEFAYKKGEFKEKDVEAVVAALPKILPK